MRLKAMKPKKSEAKTTKSADPVIEVLSRIALFVRSHLEKARSLRAKGVNK